MCFREKNSWEVWEAGVGKGRRGYWTYRWPSISGFSQTCPLFFSTQKLCQEKERAFWPIKEVWPCKEKEKEK